ncbi:MAG TPA: hypothetical protein DCE22_10925 [Verrucomicrobiales bacterium]|nr:hypothetical protein [Verrucomicrobiales bacterium]
MSYFPKRYRAIILLFCSTSFLLPQAISSPIINEFVALNRSTLYDEDGQSSDWIEIYNPNSNTIDLQGHFLTNDSDNLKKWKFPKVSLVSGGYLIVFASDKDRDNGELHTNFKISKSGGYLGLVDPDGKTVVSEFSNFPVQYEDFSYGIKAKGTSFAATLVREGDACKLLVPTSNIGTSWQSLNYNDETWSDATTGIGYERSSGYENLIGAGGDIEEQTYDKNSTAYLRIPFSIARPLDGLSSLTFRMKYDDGFIAYINGKEIASGNKPSTPDWNSDASTDHPDSQATSFVDTDLSSQASDIVRTGNNVLAIHVMNGDTRSSDLLALPRLEAQFIIKPDEGDEPKPPELGYFQIPSPGKNNGTESGLPSGPVVISQPGRGFTGNLTLTLSTQSPQSQIRYTTNGSLPTENSTLYTGGIINIERSTLLRARTFEDGLTPGPVSEAGYIRLSTDAQNFSSDLPVIIMERFSNGGATAANGKTFTFFAFFEPDPQTGRTRLNKPYSLGTRGGWKVRGSSSSGFSKKAFSIEAWNELNRNKNISPLGFPEESDFILNARSVYDRSLMRNALIYELSNQVGRYAVRTKFVELFKDDNGGNLSYSNDYDGVYTFMEKVSRDKERVNVERLTDNVSEDPGITGGYILKVDRLDPGDSGLRAGGQTLGWVYPKEDDVSTDQSNWVRNYINDMSSALSTDKFEEYIDTLSWVDHHLLNILTLNADALRLSTFFHKKRNEKLEYGPIWDFDRSMESTDGRDNNPSTWSGGTSYFTFPWWGSLFDNENFWQVYIDRYFELREGAFATPNVHSIIDNMATELNEAQARNFRRWSDQPRFGSYQGEINHLKDWLETRLDWMDRQFAPTPRTNTEAGNYPPGTKITLNANLAGNQNIYYTLDGSDPRPTAQSGPLNGTTIIDEDVNVRAFVPNSNISSSWYRDLNFNDGSWIQGTNGVGYERSNGYDPYINIDVDDEMSGRTSCYIRVKFNLTQADIEEWNYMILQMRYDDGFVAYLNGTRIASSQAPTNLNWNSSATQTHDDGSATLFQKFDASNYINQLRAGQNLLAIHALNESTSSSDFLNQVKLITGFDEDAGEGGTNGFKYTGPITLQKTARIFARVFDSDGGNSTSSGQTPVGTGWSAPLKVEYLINEDPASASNLTITEIMYDPYEFAGPESNNSDFEWIELQNTSANPISLTGVSFNKGIKFTFPGLTLEPQQSTVIVGNLEEFEKIYGTARDYPIAGEFSGALDNGGEELQLIASDGKIIQTISYPDNIAEEGHSLVREINEWRQSRTLLGSPGIKEPAKSEIPDIFINEILSNSVPPQMDTIELYNPNPFPVNISGWLLTDNLRDPLKFKIPDDAQLAEKSYLIFSENDFQNFALDSFGEEVYLIANNVNGQRIGYVDGFRFGDSASGFSIGRHVTSDGKTRYVPMSSQTFGSANSAPISGPLIITELMYHPDNNNKEYIEIKNIGSSPFNLQGTEISGIDFQFDDPDSNLLPEDILLIVKEDPATFRNNYNVPEKVSIFGPFVGSLDNRGERIRIKIPEKSIINGEPDLKVSIDIAEYSDQEPWPSSADGLGNSLHRTDPVRYAGDPSSWKAAAPSPGTTQNDRFDWRELFFTTEEITNPSLSGPLADADSDGVANILEYLLGSNPRKSESRIYEQFLKQERTNETGNFEFKIKRLKNIKGYKIIIESSTDLVNWITSEDQLTLKEQSENGDGTVTITYSTPNPLTSRRVYFRIKAVESP